MADDVRQYAPVPAGATPPGRDAAETPKFSSSRPPPMRAEEYPVNTGAAVFWKAGLWAMQGSAEYSSRMDWLLFKCCGRDMNVQRDMNVN